MPTPAAPVGAAQRVRPTSAAERARAANVERALDHRADPRPDGPRAAARSARLSPQPPAPAASPTWARTTEAAPEDDLHAPRRADHVPLAAAAARAGARLIATTEALVRQPRPRPRACPAPGRLPPRPSRSSPTSPRRGNGTQQWAARSPGRAAGARRGAGKLARPAAQNQNTLAPSPRASGATSSNRATPPANAGQQDAAIEAWRRALAANPPGGRAAGDRARLVTALNGEGARPRPARCKRSTSRTNAVVDLEGQVPRPPPRGRRSRPSRPAPSREHARAAQPARCPSAMDSLNMAH